MNKFIYKAKKNGSPVTGEIQAKTEQEAVRLLREQGLFVVSITSQKQELGKNLFNFFTNRITLSDLAQITRQLSSMITAGLTLTEALSVLQNQITKESLNKVLEEILSDVEGGKALSAALETHPKIFKPVYIAMVRAAESAGLLDQVLSRLADNLEKEKAFRAKIIGALIYPAVIVIGMFGVVLIMMLFVVPSIKNLYKELNVTLPLPTQIVISASDFFIHYWFLVAILAGLLFFAFSSYKKSEIGERQIDTFTFRIPILGRVKRVAILAELTRTLGLLVGAGTPIIAAINITAETTGSIWYKESLLNVSKKVEKGISFAQATSGDPNFPPIVVQMGKVGETTGKLDETLLKVSTYFEAEAEQLIKTLTTAFEPLIMIILGIGVGFLIISVIVPIYNLTSSF